jgi:hypothetical protein
MRPRLRSSLLWGLVGLLSFLVLVQGYELLADPGISIAGRLAVALVVGVVATGLSYLAEGALA